MEDLGGAALVDALDYVAAGYKVGPVTVRLKADGKKGALFHTDWKKDPNGISDDPDQVKAWARDHPGCGFHAPTGPNGIVVAEGDVKVDGTGRRTKDGITAWRRAGGPRSTMTVTTRSGGEHWYFRAPDEPIGNSANAIEGIPHVDVRGNRGDRSGTVFISGTTVHGGGGHYVANRIVAPSELPALPPKWAERLRRAGPRVSTEDDALRAERSQVTGRERVIRASSYHSAAWIEAEALDRLRQLGRDGSADFRDRLYTAALFGYRAVNVGLLDEAEVVTMLEAGIDRAWDAPANRDDHDHVARGRRDAVLTPWRVEAEDRPVVTAAGPATAPLSPGNGAREREPRGQDDQDDEVDELPPSWSPVDLGPHIDGTFVAPAASLLVREDGIALLYRGLVHWIYGESESGKSWVCLVAVAHTLNGGGRALFVDYESDPGAVVGRLLALGVHADDIRTGLTYVRPETSCAQEPVAFAALLAEQYEVAVVDGVTEGLGMEGGVSVDNDDVTAWTRRIPKRIARETGAAVACVDHVTKNAEGRGRFPIGGQAKLAAVDGAGYLVEPVTAIRPGAVGEIVLRVAKDRPGGVRQHAGEWRQNDRTQEAARITLDASDPAALAVTIAAPKADEAGEGSGRFTPTVYMERVSRFLATTEGEVSTKAIETSVDGRADMIRKGLDELANLGYVSRRQGPRNAVLYTFVKRYTDLQRVASGSGEDIGDGPDD